MAGGAPHAALPRSDLHVAAESQLGGDRTRDPGPQLVTGHRPVDQRLDRLVVQPHALATYDQLRKDSSDDHH